MTAPLDSIDLDRSGRRPRRLRAVLAAAMATTALAVSALVVVPTTAGASVVSQGAYCTGGKAQVGQTVRADGIVNGNGQWVSTHYYFAGPLGQRWMSPWNAPVLVPYGTPQHLASTYYLNWGTTNVWAQSAFWNGSSWYFTDWVRLDLTTACRT